MSVNREALAADILAMLPEAKILAAKFPGADPLIVARKLALAKQLAAEEPHVAPEAIAAADSDPRRGRGVDPTIYARKMRINELLRAQEGHG